VAELIKILTIIFILLIYQGKIFTQSIINTSSISSDLDSAFSLVLDVGGNFSRGNAKINNFDGNFGLGFSIRENSSLWIIGGINNLKSDDQLIQRSSFLHLRYNQEINSIFTINLYSQYQENEVLSIKNRLLYGINTRINLNEGGSSNLSLGGFYEYEQYNINESSKLFRLNIAGVTEHKLKNIEIIGFIFLQPSFEKISDFRGIGELNIRVPVINNLQISADLVSRFDSSPISTLKKLDTSLTFSFRYEIHKQRKESL
jgi:hypothetical protein